MKAEVIRLSDAINRELSKYDAIRAVNWSSLKHLAVSPLLYRWRLEHPEEPKPVWVVTSAVHCATLEPEKFDTRYAVFDGRRAGKEWAEWQKENPDRQSLKPDELERVMRSAEAVRKHKIAGPLVARCRTEETLEWTDPETGLACKGRVDGIATFVLDLKGSRDVVPALFKSSAVRYLYPGQLAFYNDGALLSGKIPESELERPWCIGVQHDEPYDVLALQCSEERVARGRALYRSLLRRLVICTERDEWPGVAPDAEVFDVLPWEARDSAPEQLTEETPDAEDSDPWPGE